jgi:hypothetical protein
MTSQTVRRADGVLERWIGDDVLLAHVHSDGILRLSGTAATIWAYLGEDRDTGNIASELSALYGADLQVVKRDVKEMIMRLTRLGYLERR